MELLYEEFMYLKNLNLPGTELDAFEEWHDRVMVSVTKMDQTTIGSHLEGLRSQVTDLRKKKPVRCGGRWTPLQKNPVQSGVRWVLLQKNPEVEEVIQTTSSAGDSTKSILLFPERNEDKENKPGRDLKTPKESVEQNMGGRINYRTSRS